MSTFYHFVTSTLGFGAKLFYKHKVYGKEHFPKGAAIIAPNHSSFWDPPFVGISAPEEIHYLARAYLFKIRWLNWIIRKLHSYPVTGTAEDLSSFKLICQLLKEDKKVVIFPEGNRSWDGKLQEFKSGIAMLALRCHAPIIPVYIHGSFDIWNRMKRFPKLYGHSAVVFGKPISYQIYEKLPKKEAQEAMTEAVKEAIIHLQQWYLNGADGNPP